MNLPAAAATPSAPSRAAQYVRMSTEHQQYSPENQLEVIRQYACVKRPWTRAAVHQVLTNPKDIGANI